MQSCDKSAFSPRVSPVISRFTLLHWLAMSLSLVFQGARSLLFVSKTGSNIFTLSLWSFCHLFESFTYANIRHKIKQKELNCVPWICVWGLLLFPDVAFSLSLLSLQSTIHVHSHVSIHTKLSFSLRSSLSCLSFFFRRFCLLFFPVPFLVQPLKLVWNRVVFSLQF